MGEIQYHEFIWCYANKIKKANCQQKFENVVRDTEFYRESNSIPKVDAHEPYGFIKDSLLQAVLIRHPC